jgi:hypothetical protein
MSPSTDSSAGDGPPSPDWQQVQTLGVADVVMTILQARKTMPLATAAAVSRERHGGGFRVRVSLLKGTPSPAESPENPENPDDPDNSKNPDNPGSAENPGGDEGAVAIFVARELGKDLTDAFGGRDVIILQ